MKFRREITAHKIGNAVSEICVMADERNPANGSASHHYLCTWTPQDEAETRTLISFQDGPIKEVGVNGITNEVLLAIVLDRLEGFQTSQWACDENREAQASVQHALSVLQLRTVNRMARGVEGTHEK